MPSPGKCGSRKILHGGHSCMPIKIGLFRNSPNLTGLSYSQAWSRCTKMSTTLPAATQKSWEISEGHSTIFSIPSTFKLWDTSILLYSGFFTIFFLNLFFQGVINRLAANNNDMLAILTSKADLEESLHKEQGRTKRLEAQLEAERSKRKQLQTDLVKAQKESFHLAQVVT